ARRSALSLRIGARRSDRGRDALDLGPPTSLGTVAAGAPLSVAVRDSAGGALLRIRGELWLSLRRVDRVLGLVSPVAGGTRSALAGLAGVRGGALLVPERALRRAGAAPARLPRSRERAAALPLGDRAACPLSTPRHRTVSGRRIRLDGVPVGVLA